MTASASERLASRTILLFALLLVITPLVYLVGLSFKAPEGIFSNPIAPFSWPPDLTNYRSVLQQMDVPKFFLNSLIYAGGVTLGQLILAIPAAFAFSYYDFRFKNLLMSIVLISLIVPFVVTYVPNYLLLARWGMLNSLVGMIIPMLGISVGFGIFLLRQHFQTFPQEVFDAARIDGANSWQVLWRVLAPSSLAPIVSVAIYVFIITWNRFIWPLLVGGGDPASYTMTVAVDIYYDNPESGANWGNLMAASVVSTLPIMLMYIALRKQILRTFTEGAVKG